MADFYEGNCRGCRQNDFPSYQEDFTDVYTGANDRLALSGWPVRDRNGIGQDGSYDPQFDYEDRNFRQSVLSDGNFQNVNYSAPRQFQADNYDESYLYDSADASQNMGPLDYEPEFGSTTGRNRQNADFSSDGQDYQVQVADRNRGWSAYDRAAYNSLIRTTDGLDGRSITEFDRSVTEDLGCARAISLAISKAYGYDIREVNVNRLENKLRTLGFSEVSSTRDVKPGDVILAYRENGDYSHSAIYLGNGEIFNNDSKTGVMRRESIEKFNSAQFKRFVVLRRPDQVPALNS